MANQNITVSPSAPAPAALPTIVTGVSSQNIAGLPGGATAVYAPQPFGFGGPLGFVAPGYVGTEPLVAAAYAAHGVPYPYNPFFGWTPFNSVFGAEMTPFGLFPYLRSF
jgi:hypothetical protein